MDEAAARGRWRPLLGGGPCAWELGPTLRQSGDASLGGALPRACMRSVDSIAWLPAVDQGEGAARRQDPDRCDPGGLGHECLEHRAGSGVALEVPPIARCLVPPTLFAVTAREATGRVSSSLGRRDLAQRLGSCVSRRGSRCSRGYSSTCASTPPFGDHGPRRDLRRNKTCRISFGRSAPSATAVSGFYRDVVGVCSAECHGSRPKVHLHMVMTRT